MAEHVHNIAFRRRGMRWTRRTRNTTTDHTPRADTTTSTGRPSLARIRKDTRK